MPTKLGIEEAAAAVVEAADTLTTSLTIAAQLRAFGTAEVMVILKTPSLASTEIEGGLETDGLAGYFISSQRRQQQSETAAAASTLSARGRKPKAALQPLPLIRQFSALGVILGSVDPRGLAGLQRDVRVAAVVGVPAISLIRPLETTPAVKDLADFGSGARLLNVPALWQEGIRGKGILVAHLDTGVDASHPALKGAIASFAEFDYDGNQIPKAHPRDSGEHGTHTAATIAGRALQGTFLGVAPEAQLASALVIEGGEIFTRVLGGLNWALTQGPRVLSMSLGIRGYYPDFLPVLQILRARGVLPVIAVGNEGPGTSRSPGNYAEALSVGACDQRKAVAWFSSSARFARADDPTVPDLVAPGVDILSAVPQGKFKRMSGTSMATPHIAGLAALLFQAVPGATIDDIEDAIFKSCALSGTDSSIRMGRGVPDTIRAYYRLTGRTLRPRPTAAKSVRKRAQQRKSPGKRRSATSGDTRQKRAR